MALRQDSALKETSGSGVMRDRKKLYSQYLLSSCIQRCRKWGSGGGGAW